MSAKGEMNLTPESIPSLDTSSELIKNLSSYELPKLNFDRCKWSDISRISRDDLINMFDRDHNLVKVIGEPRLGDNSYAILRQDTLESMYVLLRELNSGQVGIQRDYEAIFAQIDGIVQLVEQSHSDDTPLNKFVSVLRTLVIESRTRFVSVLNRQVYEPETLSEEEQAEIDADDLAYVDRAPTS